MSTFEQRVADLMEEHADRYPDMEAEDLYKLFYQAFVGVEVPITAPVGEWEILVEEARAFTFEGDASEEPIEILDPEKGLARVNVRPYLRAGGALERLFAGYEAAAKEYTSDVRMLEKAIAQALRILDGEGAPDVGFERDDFKRVAGAAARQGYAPRPHSATYKEAYTPAYRLVLIDAMGGA